MSAIENFKSSVIRIRDILRSVGITGMDSMRHICLYIMSRYMTRERVAPLGIPEQFCWENLMDQIHHQQGGMQYALDLFNHPHMAERFIDHFDRLFGTQGFDFTVSDLNKHKEILEILSKVDLTRIECKMDLLGWVYEQHLKTGASSARDLGQFFTERAICEYMVNLCKPEMVEPGVPESVFDPAMGTGGFLTTFIKYYDTHFPNEKIDWKIQIKEIFGCDSDAKVAGVARMNLFMETRGAQILSGNIATRDSLRRDPPRTAFKVIVANMPFGLKGIKYVECCERIRKAKISGTNSEMLFLLLMMRSLERGGRCAVIVPGGVLRNPSKLHIKTRRMLIQNFELLRVINMRGKFFMNTSIQTSILFFANTEFSTGDIEFLDVYKDGSGAIQEGPIKIINAADLNDKFTLDGRKQCHIEPTFISEYRVEKLMDIAKLAYGSQVTSTSRDPSGLAILTHENIFDGKLVFTKEQNYVPALDHVDYIKSDAGDIVISMGPNYGKCAHVSDAGWVIGSDICVVRTADENRVRQAFLFWALLFDKSIEQLGHQPTTEHLRKKVIQEAIIRIPPIQTQEVIIKTFNTIYMPLVDEYITKGEGQYKDIVIASCASASKFSLVDVANLSWGTQIDVKTYAASGLAVIKHKNILDGKLVPTADQNYAPETTHAKHIRPVIGDIVISNVFDCGRCARVSSAGWIISSHTCLARTKDESQLRQDFLFWVLHLGGFYEQMVALQSGTTIQGIRKEHIQNAIIRIPPVEIQDDAIARINRMSPLVQAFKDFASQKEVRSSRICMQLIAEFTSQTELNAQFILGSHMRGMSLARPSHAIADPPTEDAGASTVSV